MDDEELLEFVSVLQECIRELAFKRMEMATDAGVSIGDIGPCNAERQARLLIAPYLDIENEKLDKFLSGKLGRETFKPIVIHGGKTE